MKFEASQFIRGSKDQLSFTIFVDCNVILANIEAYADTRVSRWLNDYSMYLSKVSQAHLIANFVMQELFTRRFSVLVQTEYEMSYSTGVLEIRLVNQAESDVKSLAEAIASMLNGINLDRSR